MRTIAISSQKGGVGKTTTAANLAAVWGAMGRHVLAIDFDPQFALTRAYGVTPSEAPATIFRVLTGDVEVPDAVIRDAAPGVNLVAAERDLRNLEPTLVTQIKREEFLRRALEGHTDSYDFVLIDCPPNLGLLTVNALFAADEVVAPVDMLDPFALQGAAELVGIVNQLQELDAHVAVRALVRIKADHRRISYKMIEEALPGLNVPVAEAEVPNRAEFVNAIPVQQPLAVLKPDNAGSLAYRRLALELEQPARPALRAVA